MTRVVALASSDLYFVDFDDSFTHNILAYLRAWGDFKVIVPSQANQVLLSANAKIVWGPGPGRADEYGIDLALLRESLFNSNHRHFGICLGHQIIGLALGGRYRALEKPLHGVALEVALPEWRDWGFNGGVEHFQFYNSLVIDMNENEDLRTLRLQNSVVMLAGTSFLTCQFHPESVGTSCPERFFSNVMQSFL
tara:strand:- start:18 stop:599 length:582 start_codon:yes stop_codon:yes gene_type:complete